MKYLIFAILFSFSSYANNSNSYDKSLIESIDRILNGINEKKDIFCDEHKALRDKKFSGCSQAQINKIQSHQISAYEIITSWLKKIQDYEIEFDVKKITKTKRGEREKVSELTKASSMLKCISNKIKNARFQCDSTVKACRKGAYAYTLPIINTRLHLCTAYWQGRNHEIGLIIHELSHKCGATDSAYFNYQSTPPQSSTFVHWASIADTYEYWAQFGFCIPNIDC